MPSVFGSTDKRSIFLSFFLFSLNSGAPPGYVGYDKGGVITEYIRRRPYSVILVDELEKAAREFVQVFLQILDDGRATDSQGRTVDFKVSIC